MHALRFVLPLLVVFTARASWAEEGTEGALHTIGPRYDVGDRGHALGFGYLYFVPIGPPTMHQWSFVSVGADTRTFVGSFDRIAGAAFSGVVRVGGSVAIDHGGAPVCYAFEAAPGLLFSPEGSGGAGHVGVYTCVQHYADLGYSYQFPLGESMRPSFLSSHQFSVRVHIPLMGRSCW